VSFYQQNPHLVFHRYDPEGYSLWKVTFKYPEELALVFMSSNQIGGFFSS
jgi:elongation factor 1-gamma